MVDGDGFGTFGLIKKKKIIYDIMYCKIKIELYGILLKWLYKIERVTF